MHEHQLEVTRTARYYTLGDVEGGPREVWFVCHGYRQLARRFLNRFEPLDDGSRLIVAPEALNRFYIDTAPGPHGPESRVGATWMTREAREGEIADYVRYLDALYERIFARVAREGAMVYALGFSQGAATASRWAAYGRARIDRLILWSGALAHDIDLDAVAERLRAVRPLLVAGERDEFASPEGAAREVERLRARGITAEMVVVPGGHEMDGELLGRIAGGRG
jgi:predicted esterase